MQSLMICTKNSKNIEDVSSITIEKYYRTTVFIPDIDLLSSLIERLLSQP